MQAKGVVVWQRDTGDGTSEGNRSVEARHPRSTGFGVFTPKKMNYSLDMRGVLYNIFLLINRLIGIDPIRTYSAARPPSTTKRFEVEYKYRIPN